ncbi:MAG: 50S ribosomal protein L6 [Rhodospirillaceae bacterium]|nr:50S ribosomal protein L6 [Rhodospirillaceae bacterium]|tara:strand:+ start:3123 stop:3656 length:534 start_codon:yes stop_codon:yes gene_type:complete
MSRVGKSPVAVPDGVEVRIADDEIMVKGKLGEMQMAINPEVRVTQEGKQILFEPEDQSIRARKMWGLCRSNINNMVVGVSEGFTKYLEIQGVGYRAAVEGKKLKLDVGYSHSVYYDIPEGINITCEKPTDICVTGRNKQVVGQVAAEIRSFRKPEPYKGKGIRYKDEYVRRKEGKKK